MEEVNTSSGINQKPNEGIKKKLFIAIVILFLIGFIVANIYLFFPTLLPPLKIGNIGIAQENTQQTEQDIQDYEDETQYEDNIIGNNEQPPVEQQQEEKKILTGVGTKIYVINQFSNDVWLINLDEESVIKKIPVGNTPVDGSYDGEMLYVSNSNSDTISVIDGMYDKVVETIPTGRNPQGIIAVNGEVFVANSGENSMHAIDLKTKEKKDVEFMAGPTFMMPNAKRTRFYLASSDSNRLTIINPSIKSVIKNIEVGTRPNYAAVSDDESFAITTNKDSNDISVIPLKLQKESQRIPTGITPVSVAISEDNQLAFVANKDSGDLAVVSLNTMKVVKRIDIGTPTYVKVIGDRVYVTSQTKNWIYIIDIKKLKIIGSIPTGIGPASIVVKENV